MGHVSIVNVHDVVPGEFPRLNGLSASGSVTTRGVIAGSKRPLWLWMHELEPGAEIRWQRPPIGHVIYVWKGSVEVEGKRFASGCVICIEHGGGSSIVAGDEGAALLHYHRQEPHPSQASRAGGHVHLVGKDGVLQVKNEEYDVTTTFWLDSTCPTCELWMHKSHIVNPRPQSLSHFHPEDEIIFVVEGGMILGHRVYKPGTAIAVDANTVYSFGVDQGGVAFTNFRATEPHYVMMSRDGPKHAPLNEREQMSIGTVVSRHA